MQIYGKEADNRCNLMKKCAICSCGQWNHIHCELTHRKGVYNRATGDYRCPSCCQQSVAGALQQRSQQCASPSKQQTKKRSRHSAEEDPTPTTPITPTTAQTPTTPQPNQQQQHGTRTRLMKKSKRLQDAAIHLEHQQT